MKLVYTRRGKKHRSDDSAKAFSPDGPVRTTGTGGPEDPEENFFSRLRAKAGPYLTRAQPVAKMVKSMAEIAVHLEKPTLLGGVALACTALSSLGDTVPPPPQPLSDQHTYLIGDRAALVAAMRRAGALVETKTIDGGKEWYKIKFHEETIVLSTNGTLILETRASPQIMTWVSQLMDRDLPASVRIRPMARGSSMDGIATDAAPLSPRNSDRGVSVWEATRPLLEGGRCILFTGRPGAGKTTLAQEIARISGLGRVVTISIDMVGIDPETSSCPVFDSEDLAAALRLAGTGVIIVDDIDKRRVPLRYVEALRSSARLVIFTANNGHADEVLDGASARPERIDETFEISSDRKTRHAPFDQLSDDDWDRVASWPYAYLNEVEKRLRGRPGFLNLNELEERLKRNVRSVGNYMG